MAKIEIEKTSRHTAENMFALVMDVEKYPQFLPSCQALKLHASEIKGQCKIHSATMSVGTAKINKSFCSQIIEDKNNLTIKIKSHDAIFKYMDSTWQFTSLENSCKIYFNVEYEFASKTLSVLMSAVFDKMFKSIVQAFINRADEIYSAS